MLFNSMIHEKPYHNLNIEKKHMNDAFTE